MPYAALTRRLPSGATSPGSVLAYPQPPATQVIVSQPPDNGPREAVDTLGTTDLATRYVGSLYAAVVLADKPDLYWRLQETSGATINDSSGNGNVGTYNGITLAQPSLVPSDPTDYSVLMPNSGDMIATGYVLTPAPDTKFTVEVIATRLTNTDIDPLWGMHSNSGVTLWCPAGTNDIAFITNTGAATTYTGAMGAPGTPKHIVLTYDRATNVNELFVNGVSFSGPHVNTGGAGTNRIALGFNSGFSPFNGYLDEFAVYPGILSAAQAAAHYNAWTASTALGRTATDALGTTDVAIGSTVSVLTRTTTDALSTTDAAGRLGILARIATDTLATTDAATRTNLLRIRSAADSLGTADVTTRVAQLFVRAAADTLATTDAATRANLLRLRTGADALGTTDAAARAALALLRAGVDALGTSDAATRAALLATRSGFDTLGTSDSAAKTVQAFIRAAVDALGTTDSAVGGRFVIKSATDTLGTTDAATRSAQLFLRAAADTLATTDAAARISVRARTAADTLATTDAATRLAVLLHAAADALGTSDAATRSALLRVRSGADTLGTSDAATRLAIKARLAADTLGTSDAASRSAASKLRTAADVLGTVDAAVRANLLRLRLAVDSLGTFDSADGFVTHVTAPDLTEPLGALVISYVAKAIATEYVAKALADTPTSKTVTIEPTQKAPTQQESHAKVGVTDYAGKTQVL